MKQCTRCRNHLPEALFATLRQEGRKPRLASWCNPCTNAGRKPVQHATKALAATLNHWRSL